MFQRSVDVLVIGAGPTGLSLAAQLQQFGTRFRIVDRSLDRAHESRALGVQARTLECLDAIGLGDALVARGQTSTRLVLHFGPRTIGRVDLGKVDRVDTRYPFILFVSQAETEALLNEHLASQGIAIERGVELISFEARNTNVDCLLRHAGGLEERVRTSYLVGCDGAHSAVRKRAGFSFEGGSYPQTFVLGDVEAEGPLHSGAINAFVGGGGLAMFFPLGRPTTWRVVAVSPRSQGIDREADALVTSDLSLADLQAIVDFPTDRSVRVRDPAWITRFHLHHRQVAHYRAGRVFLAGDAAHVHSPVGAQGMNTGIQDAWNLGWKLALVLRGAAQDSLLETYEAERWPVGRFLLRYTDRIFSALTKVISAGRVASWARDALVPRILPRVVTVPWFRATAFRFVSELGIRYRHSPAVKEGSPRLSRGPRAGDRFPDARVTVDNKPVSLHRAVVGPHFTLLFCGNGDVEDEQLSGLLAAYAPVLQTRWLLQYGNGGGTLVDEDGSTLRLLGGERGAHYLVRPDGYIAFRAAGTDLTALRSFLRQWLVAEL